MHHSCMDSVNEDKEKVKHLFRTFDESNHMKKTNTSILIE